MSAAASAQRDFGKRCDAWRVHFLLFAGRISDMAAIERDVCRAKRRMRVYEDFL